MSERLALTERYDSACHLAAGFDCGKASLNRWLVQFAEQGQRRDATRTFVKADAEGAVHGYYTLLAGEIEHGEATDSVRKGLSRHFPIPVAILARLAVDVVTNDLRATGSPEPSAEGVPAGYHAYRVAYSRPGDFAAELCARGADVLVLTPEGLRASVISRLEAVASASAPPEGVRR